MNAAISARSACASTGFEEHSSVAYSNCLLERSDLLGPIRVCVGIASQGLKNYSHRKVSQCLEDNFTYPVGDSDG